MTKANDELRLFDGTVRVRSLPSFMGSVVLGTTEEQADAVRTYAERTAGFTGGDVDAIEADVWELLVAAGKVPAIVGLR